MECLYCKTTVVRGEVLVARAAFHSAWQRARAEGATGEVIEYRGQRHRVICPLGMGQRCDVMLAERLGAARERVVFKLARADARPDRLDREHEVLAALQALESAGSNYFSRRVPQALGVGVVHGMTNGPCQGLALRHPSGYWGSLDDVMSSQPHGIDPRHAVWIWRRMLEVLGFVHANGWTHGNIAPEHALVHPRDHGVLLISWSTARHRKGVAHEDAVARDLRQTAWTVRALLDGAGESSGPGLGKHTPKPVAELLQRFCEDSASALPVDAAGVQAALTSAAHASFGDPRFIQFNPAPPDA